MKKITVWEVDGMSGNKKHRWWCRCTWCDADRVIKAWKKAEVRKAKKQEANDET